jgi:hypothetical protein
MSILSVCEPKVYPVSRPVASLTGAALYIENGVMLLTLVTGKGRRAASKWYTVKEIESQISGRAFRLTAAIYCKLAEGETDYVVLLDGPGSTCTCRGHTYTGGCKHLSALLQLQNEGRI